jgi:hypothetical protein
MGIKRLREGRKAPTDVFLPLKILDDPNQTARKVNGNATTCAPADPTFTDVPAK